MKRFLCFLLIIVTLLPSVTAFADNLELNTEEEQESFVFSYFESQGYTEQSAAAITALRYILHNYKNEDDNTISVKLSPSFLSCYLIDSTGIGSLVQYDKTLTTAYDAVCFGYFGFQGGYNGGNSTIVKYNNFCKEHNCKSNHECIDLLLSYGANPQHMKLCTNLLCQVEFFEKEVLNSIQSGGTSSAVSIMNYINDTLNLMPDKTYWSLNRDSVLNNSSFKAIKAFYNAKVSPSVTLIKSAKDIDIASWHVLLACFPYSQYSKEFAGNSIMPNFQYDDNRKNLYDVFNSSYPSTDRFFYYDGKSKYDTNLDRLNKYVCNFSEKVAIIYDKYKDGQTGTYIDTDTVAGIIDEMRTTGYWTEDEISSFSRLSEMNIQAMYLDGATKENLTQSELENLEKWKVNTGYGDTESKIITNFREFIQIVGILCLIYAMLLYSAYWADRVNPFFYMGFLPFVTAITFHRLKVADNECSASLIFDKIEENAKRLKIEEVTHLQICILCLKWMFMGVLMMTGTFYDMLVWLLGVAKVILSWVCDIIDILFSIIFG